jgi:cytochrome c oxidase cbb3-type subunit III
VDRGLGRIWGIAALRLALASAVLGTSPLLAAAQPHEAAAPGETPGAPQVGIATPGQLGGHLLQVPINTITPGGVPIKPEMKSLDVNDPAALQRGMQAFSAFNCNGCHMGNGGGGMGPALSAGNFIYGGEPANIYLTIVQGRPRGMPAWGSVLPEQVVWDLVAYIQSLKSAPAPEWGQTVSASSPDIEQVPIELSQSVTPWQHTEPFKYGEKP